MQSPYITPAMLQTRPTGVPWSMVPWPKANNPQQLAAQTDVCWTATNQVDAICNQPLRSTLSTERVDGPDYRATVDQLGVGRIMLSRWPVTQILGGRVSPRAAFPRQWSTIPVTAMDMESPPLGTYGTTVEGASGAGDQAILVAPGYLSWSMGRKGWTAEVSYFNGWPHCGITAQATEGTSTLTVDDVTGMAGASCFAYDGGATETVQVTAATATTPVTLPTGGTVQTGPGVLTLAAPLAQTHPVGVLVSALPQDAIWAAVLLATVQALDPGNTSVTIQTVSGSESTGGKGIEDLTVQAESQLAPYRRVI